MTAPESVVRAILDALRDHRPTTGMQVASGQTCACGYWTGSERQGPTPSGWPLIVNHAAREAADAAWVAARREALLEAAERAAWEGNGAAMERFTEIFLRHMADESPE